MQLRNVLPNLASPRSLVAVVMMSPTKGNSPISASSRRGLCLRWHGAAPCCRFFGGCGHFESLRFFARPRLLLTFETVSPTLGSLPLLIETVVAEV
jgi:hypothetical protein